MASAVATCGLCGAILTPHNSVSSPAKKFERARQHAGRRVAARRIGAIRAQESNNETENETTTEKVAEKETKTSLFTSITDALDFAETRSEKDAELLADARDATRSGEQMSREQYAALRRKVGGTYKDFFKDSIDVVGDYVDDGWVDKTCRVCKKDTSNEPRTKDSMGRYAHVECMEKEPSGNFFTRLFGK